MLHTRARKWLVGLGMALAIVGTIGSILVIYHAQAPPAEGSFGPLWITIPAGVAGVGMVLAAMVARGRAAVAASLWMLLLCGVPYAWGVIRAVREEPTSVGTLGTLILLVLGVPGVLLLLWVIWKY